MTKNFCMNSKHSDVTFIVENIKIPAHKTILMMRSPYFVYLLNGHFVEATQSEIKLQVPLDAFKLVLRYIYTGQTSLAGLEVDQIIDVFSLADLYEFESLKKPISKYSVSNISMSNCCAFLDAASLYTIDALQNACLAFMDRSSMDLLNHEMFRKISTTSLCILLKRDSFYAPEIDIFKAIKSWSTNNTGADIKVS